MRYLPCLLLAGLLGAAGCQSHKVAFRFRPAPAYATHSPTQPQPDPLPPSEPAVVAPPRPGLPTVANRPSHAVRPSAGRQIAQLPTRYLKAVQAPGRRLMPKLRRSTSTASTQLLGTGVKIGLAMLGLGLAILLLTLLLASGVATFEGFLLVLLGVSIGGALAVAGLLTIILGLAIH